MIVNMIFFFEWEKGETDDFETHVAFAWLQKRNENVCIVRESNPGRPRGRRAFYHWTNDACTLWRHHIQNWLQHVSKRNYTAAWAVVAEWLRRLTRNEFPFGSVGSNPTNCENFRCFYQIAIPREISGSHLKQKGPTHQVRPCGLMDKAPDFGSGDCRFESCHGRINNFLGQNILLQVRLELTTPAFLIVLSISTVR